MALGNLRKNFSRAEKLYFRPLVRPQLSSCAWVLPSVPDNPEPERRLTGERDETHLVEVERLAGGGFDGGSRGHGAGTIVFARIANGNASCETRSERRPAETESARPHRQRCEERAIDRRRNRQPGDQRSGDQWRNQSRPRGQWRKADR